MSTVYSLLKIARESTDIKLTLCKALLGQVWLMALPPENKVQKLLEILGAHQSVNVWAFQNPYVYEKIRLRGLSPRANSTERATAACRRS
jgi:hypothetical protein